MRWIWYCRETSRSALCLFEHNPTPYNSWRCEEINQVIIELNFPNKKSFKLILQTFYFAHSWCNTTKKVIKQDTGKCSSVCFFYIDKNVWNIDWQINHTKTERIYSDDYLSKTLHLIDFKQSLIRKEINPLWYLIKVIFSNQMY